MNLWLRIFLPFAAGYYFSYFLRNVNAVIAPELTRELGVSAADLGLLTSAYLLAFGAVQLPLGLALDRWGARRVESTLLLIAAAGCALFAMGTSLTQLAVARALIGLGVSACLMASFKAFGQWFGMERQASLNAAIMAAGGLGALTASTPLSWAIPAFGWRTVFIALAIAGVAVAAGIFSTPEKAAGGTAVPLRQQVAGLIGVLTSRAFWRYAPQSTLIIGGFMALQGLWAVPWLMNFSGLTREVAAHHLLLWLLLPRSVFNYDASVWTVVVHALFVVLESVAPLGEEYGKRYRQFVQGGRIDVVRRERSHALLRACELARRRVARGERALRCGLRRQCYRSFCLSRL